MKNTIMELWYGNVAPAEKLENAEINHSLRLMVQNSEKLEEILDNECKDLFDKYCESANEHAMLSVGQSFHDGFCLGARMAIEAIIGAEKLI